LGNCVFGSGCLSFLNSLLFGFSCSFGFFESNSLRDSRFFGALLVVRRILGGGFSISLGGRFGRGGIGSSSVGSFSVCLGGVHILFSLDLLVLSRLSFLGSGFLLTCSLFGFALSSRQLGISSLLSILGIRHVCNSILLCLDSFVLSFLSIGEIFGGCVAGTDGGCLLAVSLGLFLLLSLNLIVSLLS